LNNKILSYIEVLYFRKEDDKLVDLFDNYVCN